MKQMRNELGFFEESPEAVACRDARRRPVKSGTYIARLVQTIESSLVKLGVNIQKDPELYGRQIEQMAILIHDSMSASTRNYHSVQHVVSPVSDQILILLFSLFLQSNDLFCFLTNLPFLLKRSNSV